MLAAVGQSSSMMCEQLSIGRLLGLKFTPLNMRTSSMHMWAV